MSSLNPLAFNYSGQARAEVALGVVNFNRRALLESCIDCIRRFTTVRLDLIVADDGSSDGCAQMLREADIPVIGQNNRGIAWNKNRALVALLEYSGADVILLMENDCRPAEPRWAEFWLEAVALHGYINALHPSTARQLAEGTAPPEIIGGAGTAQQPYRCVRISGICIGSSRVALAKVGFLDTRFRGYGHEHAEWTTRFQKEGYGVYRYEEAGEKRKANLMIRGGVLGMPGPSSCDKSAKRENYALFQRLKSEPNFRPPWHTTEERQLLLEEVQDVAQLKQHFVAERFERFTSGA